MHNYKKTDKKTFDTDLKSTNWNQILKLNPGNTNNYFEIFFETFNKILDKHAPLRNLFIQEEKPYNITSLRNKEIKLTKY